MVRSCSHSATTLNRHLLGLLGKALSTSRRISSLSSLHLRELLLLVRWVDSWRKLLRPYLSITVLRLVLLLPVSASRWRTGRIFNTAASATIESIQLIICLWPIPTKLLGLDGGAVHPHSQLNLLLVKLPLAHISRLDSLCLRLRPR